MIQGPEPRVQLRLARPDDAPALAALQRGIYNEGRWFVGDGALSSETLAHRLRLLEPQRSLYLLAVAADAQADFTYTLATGTFTTGACGWLELHRMQPKRLGHVAVLTLAVAPAFRGRGIASELLAQAYGWARGAGVEKVQLSVREHNRAAISLYRREGFVLEGREVRQVRDAGRYEDNLLMAKFL